MVGVNVAKSTSLDSIGKQLAHPMSNEFLSRQANSNPHLVSVVVLAVTTILK